MDYEEEVKGNIFLHKPTCNMRVNKSPLGQDCDCGLTADIKREIEMEADPSYDGLGYWEDGEYTDGEY